MKVKPFRIPAALALIAIVSAVFAACGSGDTAVVAPQDTSAPVAVAVETTGPDESEKAQVSAPAPEAMTDETQAMVPVPADTSADTPVETAMVETDEKAIVDLVMADDPATTEALESEAVLESDAAELESMEAALVTSYSDYGFALKLDLGADVQSAGWTEPEPSLTQGIIAFAYGGVNANLVWGPFEDRTPLTFLADTYNILRASQPSVTFESISDGDVSISDQEGVYGGFKAIDNSGNAIGGGLIGAWVCGDSETAFRMTLTGEDATVVQLRFDRLLENFACSSS